MNPDYRSIDRLIDLARQAYIEGHERTAAELYRQAWEHAERAGDRVKALVARYWIASSLCDLHRDSEAIPHFAALIATRDDVWDKRSRNFIGMCYANFLASSVRLPLVDVDNLLIIAAEGIAWCERWLCYGGLLSIYCERGRIYDVLGDLEMAIRDSEKAVAMKRRRRDIASYGYWLSSLLIRLAGFLIRRADGEDLSRARVLLEEALEHAKGGGEPVRILGFQAALALRQGHLAIGERHLKEALHAARQLQSWEYVWILESLVNLCIDQGRLNDAEQYLREAARAVLRALEMVQIYDRFNLLESLARLRTAQAATACDSAEALRLQRKAHNALKRQLHYARMLDGQIKNQDRTAAVEAALAGNPVTEESSHTVLRILARR